jgi:hypothetical protein
MDGYKIRAKLALNFPKALGNAEAEEVMMQYARAFAGAVECELSNGDLPFEEHELLKRITDHVTALPKKNVRLIGLHVWHKGAVSSGSMLAVKPGGEGKPTVPAMAAVSQTRERTPSSAAAHSAATIKPPEAPISEPRSAVTTPAGAPVSRQTPTSSRNPESASAARPSPSTQRSAPAGARSMPSGASQSMPSSRGVASQSPISSRGASGVSSQSPAAVAAAARVASGMVPAVEPRIVRTKSGFSVAIEQCGAETGEAVGRAMAQPVRDAAAGVLLSTLDALHGVLSDPLGLVDGRADAELKRGLVGEACVCVCYVLYEALTRTSLPQMLAIEVVQGACVHALMDKAMPVSEISRYLATESPREEFAARVCTLLGVRENPEMQQRVESALRALRLDVRSCAEQIEQRITQGKAQTSQKVG